MKLKKCRECNSYTLKENCPKCKTPTKDAHYKFLKFWSPAGKNTEI